jgi:hypothetical protein
VIRWNLSSTQRRLALAAKDSDPAAYVTALTAIEQLCSDALLDAPRYLRFVERRAMFRLDRATLGEADEDASISLIRSVLSDLESLGFMKQLDLNTSPASKTLDLSAIQKKITSVFTELIERRTAQLFSEDEIESKDRFDLPNQGAIQYFMTNFVTEGNFAQCSSVDGTSTSISRAMTDAEILAINETTSTTFEQQLAQESDEARSFCKRRMWSDAFVALRRANASIVDAWTSVVSNPPDAAVDSTEEATSETISVGFSLRTTIAAVQVLIDLSSFYVLCLNRPKLDEVLSLAETMITSLSEDDRAGSFEILYLSNIVALRRVFALIENGDAEAGVEALRVVAATDESRGTLSEALSVAQSAHTDALNVCLWGRMWNASVLNKLLKVDHDVYKSQCIFLREVASAEKKSAERGSKSSGPRRDEPESRSAHSRHRSSTARD